MLKLSNMVQYGSNPAVFKVVLPDLLGGHGKSSKGQRAKGRG